MFFENTVNFKDRETKISLFFPLIQLIIKNECSHSLVNLIIEHTFVFVCLVEASSCTIDKFT